MEARFHGKENPELSRHGLTVNLPTLTAWVRVPVKSRGLDFTGE
jgi:hypothetical protein